MATKTSWKEIAKLAAEAEIRANDAATLDAYRWNLLQASAHLSTARLIINQPTPGLDVTEARLLEPFEAASTDALTQLFAELAPGVLGPQGRSR